MQHHAPSAQTLLIDWCEVPPGPFVMGSHNTRDNPRRQETTDGFLIGRHPVTNRQYAAFVAANPRWRKGAPGEDVADVDYLRDWDENGFPEGTADLPVAWIPWQGAVAFCAWASQMLGLNVFLPSEKHWEKASRGGDGRTYPWGEGIDETRANYSSRANPVGRLVDGRLPVGACSPAGDSPFGCVDMAGNVWEWCDAWMDEYEEERVLRGGGWNFTPDFLTCAFRFGGDPRAAYNYIGFRCAADVKNPVGVSRPSRG